jgi:uncharacterized protein with GYD domain
MAFYLFTANYTHEAMQAMVKNPSDREAAARKVIEAAGGKLHHMFMAFGPTDVFALCEYPDDIGMAAASLAVGSAGGVTNAATTKLLTPAEFSEAMRRAGDVAAAYTPPQG